MEETAQMTTKEHAAAIRQAYKAKGWTARDISVRIHLYSMGSSIYVVIKNPDVPFKVVEDIANGAESIRRCEYSGEILSGGNRYVHVNYSSEARATIHANYAGVLTDAARALGANPNDNSLHEIGDTGFLLGKGTNGYGFSLWKDSHIQAANEAIHLATTLHTRLQSVAK